MKLSAIFPSIKKYRRDIVTSLVAGIAVFSFMSIFTYVYFVKDLKSEEILMNRRDTGLVLYDRNNQSFFHFYEAKNKTYVPLSKISPFAIQAVIVAEDKDFYNHPGFSIQSILASLVANVKKKELTYGGSTITQQLVKITLLSSKKNFLRKYQELILSQEIERRFTKNQIIEMYLNTVYFGEGAFGIEEAAKTYFNTSAKNLTLGQASYLAALLNAPSKLSPFSQNKEKGIKRQKYVLSQMVEEKSITQRQKEKALKNPLIFNPVQIYSRNKAPHFALMVRDELIKKYGEEQVARSGFQVYTSLDLPMQEYAESVVKQQVEKLKASNVSNGAAVVMNPKTGEILALVGSKDWNDTLVGKFNIATAKRQPGSAFKPIVYAAALEKHIITPATVLKDQPTTYSLPSGNYSPQNYDRKFRGYVAARRALANSLNVPSVEIMSKLGVPAALDMARRLGITTLQDSSFYGLSLVLGAGEVKLLDLTAAYATLANSGIANPPTAIIRIDDKFGKTIYKYQTHGKQAIEPEYAFLISSILSDNAARSEVFGNILTISRPVAVKTGTTENYKDALTIGYTPSLAVGVWIGNNDNKYMERVAGSIGAAPIWKSIMEEFLKQTPVETFTPPSAVISKNFCLGNGQVEYFAPGTQPFQSCVGPSKKDLEKESSDKKKDND